MSLPGWTRRLPVVAVAGLIVAAVAVFASQQYGGSLAAQQQPPAGVHEPCDPATAGDVRFCPQVSVSLSDTAPGANADTITTLTIPAPNYNFRAVISFIPEEFDVAPGASIPIGAVAGQLTSSATLGLLNSACSTPVAPTFTMLNATTDLSEQIPIASPPDAPGEPNQFVIQDGLPLGVTKYPDYLARTFDTAPLARQYGQTDVSGTPVSLNFVIFGPIAGIGYPSVSVLQNAGDPGAEPMDSPITDFCTPLDTQTVAFGISQNNPNTAADESGAVVRSNPDSEGAFVFTTLTASLWDTNRNGIENGLDPCKHKPWDPGTAGWNPRTDGQLPPAEVCGLDAWPADPSALDVDGDGFTNRGDNCPWIANDDQADANSDGVGDACYAADGHNPAANPVDLGAVSYEGCRYASVNLGAGGTAQNPACPDLATLAPPPAEVTATPTPAPDDDDPTPTPGPGVATPTPRPGTVAPDVGAGPVSGVGSLAPAVGSIPAWAAAISALGGTGLLSTLAYFALRLFRRRDDGLG